MRLVLPPSNRSNRNGIRVVIVSSSVYNLKKFIVRDSYVVLAIMNPSNINV